MSHLDVDGLTRRVVEWHGRSFPGSPNAAIGLKLAEEAGECAKAVNLLEHGPAAWRTAYLDNLQDEIGDVVIVLVVLAHRYGLDLEEIVRSRSFVVTNRTPGPV